MLKQFTSVITGVIIFVFVILLSSSIYIVDETKQVFVTRFGQIVRGPINSPSSSKPHTASVITIDIYLFPDEKLELSKVGDVISATV